jgi:hypothetical protein
MSKDLPTGEVIVKIQRPLATTARVPEAFINTKGREFFTTVPYTLVRRLFPRGVDVVYYFATFAGSTLSLDREAPPQNW